MAALIEVVDYCHVLLNPLEFDDYCPNGLQLDAGRPEVQRLVAGVTACQGLIDAAGEWQADLLLVHHGFFWKGEPPEIVGIKGRRVRKLIQQGTSLLAFHLPLDAHPEVGNNRQLADRFQIPGACPVPGGDGLLWHGTLAEPESPSGLAARIATGVGREPLHIPGGADLITRVGWCSGAAQGYIEQAAAAGLDAFVSGEVSEQTVHLAKELGIHYYAAGHHATERYGVQSLGQDLQRRFGLQYRFIDIPNPV